jgi:hypothetical protein
LPFFPTGELHFGVESAAYKIARVNLSLLGRTADMMRQDQVSRFDNQVERQGEFGRMVGEEPAPA